MTAAATVSVTVAALLTAGELRNGWPLSSLVPGLGCSSLTWTGDLDRRPLIDLDRRRAPGSRRATRFPPPGRGPAVSGLATRGES